jgi:hypothetical protein
VTDDLVKRLRKKEVKAVNENGYTEIGYRWGPIFDEAADRIEQLEAALRKITQTAPFGEPQEIARAALGEKKDAD